MNVSLLLPVAASVGLAVSAGRGAPPATLLEIAGVNSAPGRLAQSVVLIIDAQREYSEGGLPLVGMHAALHETHRLLQRARLAQVPIVHVQQLSPAGRRIFVEGTPMADFAADAAPLPGEIVVTKKLPNSFAGTSLEATLRMLGRTELIVSGYMTHMCVSATVRSAVDHGFHVTVAASACATRDLRDADGNTVPAATVHRVALAELADRFATVVRTVDDIPD